MSSGDFWTRLCPTGDDNILGPALVRKCLRCGGRGYIPRFGHVLKGVCFECNGIGARLLGLRSQERLLRSIDRMARALGSQASKSRRNTASRVPRATRPVWSSNPALLPAMRARS